MSMPYRPPIEVQRQQITNAREQFRQMGYAAELDIDALQAQDAGDIDDQIKGLERKRDNAYAAARKMDEKLSKLPAPKPEKVK